MEKSTVYARKDSKIELLAKTREHDDKKNFWRSQTKNS